MNLCETSEPATMGETGSGTSLVFVLHCRILCPDVGGLPHESHLRPEVQIKDQSALGVGRTELFLS